MDNTKIIFYGAQWCGDCQRTKFLLEKNNVKYEYQDIDENPEALEYVKSVNLNGFASVPVLVINTKGKEEIMIEPKPEEIQRLIS